MTSKPATTSPHVDLRNVTRTYATAANSFTALRDVTVRIGRGEFATVVGPSGSGKSTLLNVLSGIDRPTSGEVYIDGAAVHALPENQASVWRGRNVGVVFQFFQLLPTLTAAENVLLPMDFANAWPADQRIPRALQLLERMGVADQADKLPATLSGGQQQRVAIARALANDPPLLAADEPTGNLDSKTSESVIELFAELAAEGKTVVMATHERGAARYATRAVALRDGVVVSGGEE